MRTFRLFAGPALSGLLVGLAVLWWYEARPGAENPATHHPQSYAPAVRAAAPAVVNIYTTQFVSRSLTPRQPFSGGFMDEAAGARTLAALGSGVIVSPKGYLLTSYHVMLNADEILVALIDGREAPARLVGSDPETDLALLHISLDALPAIPFAEHTKIQVGDVVLAIGNPLGVGQTVSAGIISAMGRNNLGIATFENFIQTDAAINQGNSGGALVNAVGDLIGINTAILSSDGSWQGIGFATPVSTARKVMNDLIEYGRVLRGWLGVAVQDITPLLAQSLELDSPGGTLVTEVVRNGPAHLGGLRPGDILTTINGTTLANAYQAMTIITDERPGATVSLEILRHGRPMTLRITIGTRPAP